MLGCWVPLALQLSGSRLDGVLRPGKTFHRCCVHRTGFAFEHVQYKTTEICGSYWIDACEFARDES